MLYNPKYKAIHQHNCWYGSEQQFFSKQQVSSLELDSLVAMVSKVNSLNVVKDAAVDTHHQVV